MLIAGIAVLLINRRKLNNRNAIRLLLIAGAVGIVIAVVGFPIISERAAFLLSDWDALTTKGDHTTALGLRVSTLADRAERLPRHADFRTRHCCEP